VLILAVGQIETECVRLLLDAGADTDLANNVRDVAPASCSESYPCDSQVNLCLGWISSLYFAPVLSRRPEKRR
jgi:hypothetical protein